MMDGEQAVLHIKEEIQDDEGSFPCTELQNATNLFLLSNDEQAECGITHMDSSDFRPNKMVPEQNPDTNSRDQSMCMNQFSKFDILEIDLNEMNNEVNISPSSGEQQKSPIDENGLKFQNIGRKPFICSICGEKFSLLTFLLDHKRSHMSMKTSLQQYTCSVCELGVVDKASLDRHIKTHTDEKLLRCHICEKNFRLKSTMQAHMKTHKSEGAEEHLCQRCGREFYDKSSLRRHMKTSTNEKCSECEKLFCNKITLARHMKSHSNKVTCASNAEEDLHPTSSDCARPIQKGFRDSPDFKRRTIKRKKEGLYCCSYCKKSFRAKSALDAHITKAHASEIGVINPSAVIVPLPCDEQGKITEDINAFNAHQEVLNDSSRPTEHICQRCGNNFYDKNSLRRHTRTSTNEKCSECEKLFCNKFKLTRHMKSHSNKKACKSYKQDNLDPESSDFIQHMQKNFRDSTDSKRRTIQQKNERQYHCCPHCQKCFQAKSTLGAHIVKAHAKELGVNSPLIVASVSCETCGKLFRYKCHLERHQRIHNSKKTYQYSCDRCGIKFPEKYRLDTHRRSKVFKCPKCEKLFCNKHLYDRHIVDHDIGLIDDDGIPKAQDLDSKLGEKVVQKIFICSQCFKGFGNLTDLKQHEKTHIDERKYPCPKCGESFHRRKILEAHLKIHSHEFGVEQSPVTASLICHICGKSFSRVPSLRQHWRIHHGKSTNKLACEDCGEKFKTQHDLDQHKEYLTSKNAIKCPKCEDVFCNEKLLAWHVRVHYQNEADDNSLPKKQDFVNGRDKKYFCSICGRGFRDWSALKQHKLTHIPSDERPYLCRVCYKYFPTKSTMEAHKITAHARHAKTTPEPCGICGKIFKTLETLKNHLKLHNDKRAYTCGKCGKKFQDQCEFVRHKRSGTGEDPAKCPKCEELFCNKKLLKPHLKNHYPIILSSGDKPYKCSECEKCFKELHFLNRHIRLHIGPGMKIHACTKCTKTFRDKYSLMQHLGTHMGVRPYSCYECDACFSSKYALTQHYKDNVCESGYSAQNVESSSVTTDKIDLE